MTICVTHPEPIATCSRCQVDVQIAATDKAIAESAEAIARLREPIPDDYPRRDPTDTGRVHTAEGIAFAESAEGRTLLAPRDSQPCSPPCPNCGLPLVVDVSLHPTSTGTLLGVAHGFKPCGCVPL